MHVHESAAHVVHDHAHIDGRLMAHEAAAPPTDGALPVKDPQKSADTRCCGLVSLSAIPVAEVGLVAPAALTSRCETESTAAVADNAPPRLYRPPIS